MKLGVWMNKFPASIMGCNAGGRPGDESPTARGPAYSKDGAKLAVTRAGERAWTATRNRPGSILKKKLGSEVDQLLHHRKNGVKKSFTRRPG